MGQRYINHIELEEHILLFVREFKEDHLGSVPYTYLGLADYVKHDGSKPMNIVWKLRNKIPAKFRDMTNYIGIH